MAKRLNYIDWLRVLGVLLLFPFHSGRVFNFGEPFYVKAEPTSQLLGLVLPFISVWHMPLLFLLAGASSYLALRKRAPGEYARERLLRLGVPFLFGVVAITSPQGWFGAVFNSGYKGSFLDYVTSGKVVDFSLVFTKGDYFGGFVFGHLWFILFLLLMSLFALPLFAWARGERGGAWATRWSKRLAKPAWWLLPAVILFLVEGLPKLGDKNLFYYMAYFVLGYVAFADDGFAEATDRYRWPALVGGFGLSIAYVVSYAWREALPDPSVLLTLVNIGGMLGAWMSIVGLIGLGKRHLDRPSPALSYLAEASYPLYIFHQTVIIAIAFYLVTLPIGMWARYLLLITSSVAVTFALYEGVRRVGVLRFLFGMRPAPKAQVEPEVAAA